MNSLPVLRQRLPCDDQFPRHRHRSAYAAVVLAGRYLEASELGRRWLGPGDVALHAPFAAHLNRISAAGVSILNLPVTGIGGTADSFGCATDPDAIARLARDNAADAAALLQSMFRPTPAQGLDWPDRLALELAVNPALPLADWARQQGLSPETISRGFRAMFGVTPKRMRYEVRARRALHAVTDTHDPLVQIALETGFADQARMTNAVRDISGRPPGFWRIASSAVKTGAA